MHWIHSLRRAGADAGLLALALVFVVRLGLWSRVHGTRRHEAAHEAAIGGGMFDGLKQVFATPFIRTMAILMVLGDAIGTIAYMLVTDYSGATFHDAVSRTQFAADIDLVTNVIQVVAQLTVTRWLLARHGAAPVLAVRAIVGILACIGLALAVDPYAQVIGPLTLSLGQMHFALSGLPWVALMLILTRSLAYGMDLPARETLFTLVPRGMRYKGKNAVDTAVWRAGDVVSALGVNGLRAVGAGIGVFGWIGAAALAASGAIGWTLARKLERASAAGEVY